MRRKTKAENHHRFLLGLIVFGLAAAVILQPFQFRSEAGGGKKAVQNSFRQTKNHKEDFENYDIRADKNEAQTLINFRAQAGKNAVETADSRDKFAAGEKRLQQKVSNLRVEYSKDTDAPEVIAPDVKKGGAFLSNASAGKRSEILRNFIKENNDLLGIGDEQANLLKAKADYTNPDKNLSFASFEQEIGGVPVFRGEVKAGFTKNGEIIRVVNNLAADLDYKTISIDFGSPAEAVKNAARNLNHELKADDSITNSRISDDKKTFFGKGDWATTAEKMYFPVEAGVVRAAWRVLIWQQNSAYYVIVDAETGKVLWRKNIAEDQTEAATFSVFANPNAMINVARSPFPSVAGLNNPALGQQGAALNRTIVSRIGNEFPYTFNNKGWITDGETQTDGNAVEAGIDRDGTDGVDPQGKASAGANRSFVYNFTPGNPNSNSGDAPNPATQIYPITDYQNAAVAQLFYISNWFHDETYRLGFTEQAYNFQNDNFGRGGAAGDRISAEAQDSSGTNNANFYVPADGTRGKMQMYIWDAPEPDFDGDFDADVVIHELAHGLSSRLHGNSSGLNGTMARGMGEGWSDFYAHSLLSEPNDPIDGVYPMGSYATYMGKPGYTGNYYYGIRRFPKAIMSSVGANGKPHNPLTFRHLNSNCNVEIGTSTEIGTISAYPRGAFGSTTCDQVHAAGEIWSSALWEVRARFVRRLGWETGNRKTLQLVTDGMKLAPVNPTFLQERDAILAAARATASETEAILDVADVWEGFRIRGMGFSAAVNGTFPANVTEAFDSPNLVQTPGFVVNDSEGNNNGVADVGEKISLSIPLTNGAGKTAIGATLQISGGGAANYGDVPNNQTVARSISFTVPTNQACGSLITLSLNINSSLGAKTETRDLIVGQAVLNSPFNQNFDNIAAPLLPEGWTASAPDPSTGSAIPWQTSAQNSSSAPNSVFAPSPDKVYLARLESPIIPVKVSAAKLKFKINYNTENGWDGVTFDIKIGSNDYRDIIESGGKFVSGGYSNYISGGSFPNAGRRAWTGNSNGFVNVEIILPASASGQNVRFRWNAGADTSVSGAGTYIDNVEVITDYACASFGRKVKSRADFDGDGKTDFSVFRPAEGNWFLNESTDGFKSTNWGVSTDTPVSGDFDGDGKADVAVFRPSNGVWYILKSSDKSFSGIQWGLDGDLPLSGDFDGDGKSDVAVYRPSDGIWYLLRSRDGFAAAQFGVSTDKPVPADFDGDGKTDVAVYRNGLWIINKSSGGVEFTSFGLETDKPVAADFDGDDKDDIAVYRPSNGVWYVLKSSGGFEFTQFGVSTDVPVPGDYDGDGRDDIAVYRDGNWYVNASKAGFYAANFGNASDKPIPK